MANDIEIRVRVANQTQAGMTAVNASLNTLRTRAGTAGSALNSLSTRATAAAAALQLLNSAADEAGDALRRLRSRAAAASASLADLRTDTTSVNSGLRTLTTRAGSADSRLGDLITRTRTLRSDMDDLDGSVRRLGTNLGGLRGTLGTLSTSSNNAAGGQRALLTAAIALAPALIPIAAAAAPIVPALGAAAVAMGAFGAALIPGIVSMAKISEAQKKYTDAVAEHGKASQQATKAETAYLKLVERQSPAVREAAAALSVLKDEYKEWTKSLEGDTLPLATRSFAIFGALFPKLTPLVRGTSNELDRLMNRLAAGVDSPGFDAFMVKFTDFSNRTLHRAIDGIVSLGSKLAGLGGNTEFQRFLDYAKENGPLVAETLKNLARAAATLVEGLSGAGVTILTVVNALASLVAAIPPGALSVFIQGYAAFKLFSVGVALMSASVTAGLIGRIGAFFAVMRAAGVATTLRATAASMSAVTKAGLAMGVLAAATLGISKLAEKARGAPPDVDRLTTSLKKLAETGKFSGELQKQFGDIDGLVEDIGKLGNAAKEQDEYIESFGTSGIGPLDDLRRSVHGLFDDLVDGEDSLRSLQDRFKGVDEGLTNLVQAGHADVAARNFQAIANAAVEGGHSLKEVKELLPGYQDAVAALAADQEVAARAMGLFGQQAQQVQAKLDGQKQSTEGLRASLHALNNAYLVARGGIRGMEAAIDAADKAIKANGRTLDENTEKGRANNQALDDLAAATMKAAEAVHEQTGSWSATNAVLDRGKGKLIEAAQQMGHNREQAKRLADQILRTPNKTARLKGNMEDLQAKLNSAKRQLARVPDSRKAAVRANIYQLEQALAKARRQLDALNGKTADTFVVTHYSTTGKGLNELRFAHGGIIGAAGGGPRSRMTLVGEQGPELVDLAPGSRVRSNPDTRRMLSPAGGGGGGMEPLHITLVVGDKKLGEVVIDPLRKAVADRGGNVQAVLGRGRG